MDFGPNFEKKIRIDLMEKEDKTYSLIFVRDVENKKVLLGMKRRGFGVGKSNILKSFSRSYYCFCR